MAQFIFANFPLGIPCGQDVRTHYIRCIVNVKSLIVYSQRSASVSLLFLLFFIFLLCRAGFPCPQLYVLLRVLWFISGSSWSLQNMGDSSFSRSFPIMTAVRFINGSSWSLRSYGRFFIKLYPRKWTQRFMDRQCFGHLSLWDRNVSDTLVYGVFPVDVWNAILQKKWLWLSAMQQWARPLFCK